MDPLSDILRSVRLTGAVLFRARARAPWAVAAPPLTQLLAKLMPEKTHHRIVVFHVVTSGTGVLEHDGEIMELGEGDLIVVRQSEGHVLGDAPGRDPVAAGAVLPPFELGNAPPVVELGGDGDAAGFTCGFFLFDAAGFNPILPALPPVMRLRSSEGPPSPWLRASLDYVIAESEANRPGSTATLGRLTELLFVEMVRAHLGRLAADERSWLAGLKDPVVGRALELVHEDPGHAWNVESLARRCAASRSGLAKRFSDLVGEPPMQYVTRLRVHRAAERLRDGEDGIASVAADFGYDSEAAFNRAFKRVMGQPPGAWRQRARASA